MRSTLLVTAVVATGIARMASAVHVDDFAIYTVGADAACMYQSIQDAVDAAAQHPGADYVWIASNMVYTDQHVVVTGQDVEIEGGFTDCNDFDPGLDQTVINGTSGHSVFEIEGTSNVFLGNLEITGASMNTDHSGGGVYFGGQGSLTLRTTWVFANTSGYGGGIDMSPSGPSTLALLQGTTVSGNTALVSGGGIRIEGQTVMTSTSAPGEPLIYIAQNSALGEGDAGYGGGIEIVGPAAANVSSVVDLNAAQYGGGVAVVTNGNGNAILNLYATNPDAPPTIYGNHASSTGGGVYALPTRSAFSYADAIVCANNFVIDANVAQEGAAIYGDENHTIDRLYEGSQIYLNDSLPCVDGALPPPQDGVVCTPGIACNEINDNVAADSNAQPTAGATVLLQTDGYFQGGSVSMRGNQGGSLIHEIADDEGGSVALNTCLLVGNTLSGNLISATPDNEGDLSLDRCTIADNAIAGSFVILAQVNRFGLSNSIVDQPGKATVDFTGSTNASSYVLATEIDSLVGSGITLGEPEFVDPANGNYRQSPSSSGVDYAPSLDGRDFDGHPRSVDLSSNPNEYGPMDLGPYEAQYACGADTIFCSGFDGG